MQKTPSIEHEHQVPVISKKTRYQQYAVLLVIGVISLAIRIWLLDMRWINADEGAHMMDAVLILDGAIPSVDFASRQPVYAYSIAAVFKLLGVGYVSGRTLTMVLSLLVALPIFFTARMLYNDTVAFLATAIYFMLPLEILNSVVVKTEPLSMMLISLSFLMMAKFSQKQAPLWLLPAGVLAALGFYVRQSALIVPIAALVFLVVYGSGNIAVKTRRLIYFLGGYVLVVLVVVLFYSRYLAFTDIWNGNLNPLYFVLESFKKIFQLIGITRETANIAVPQMQADSQASYALYYRYISQAFKMHLFLVMGAAFSMLWGFYHVIVKKTRKLTEPKKRAHSPRLTAGLASESELDRIPYGRRFPAACGGGLQYPSLLLYLWLILLALAYVYYFRARGFYIDYFREFFPPLCILFAVWLTSAFPDLKKENKAIGFILVAGVVWAVLFLVVSGFKGLIPTKGVILIILFLPAVFQFYRWKIGGFKPKEVVSVLSAVVVLVISGYNLAYMANRLGVQYDSNWSTASVTEVSGYIAKNTLPTESVVSGAVIWELEAGRRPFLSISHPLEFSFAIPEKRRTVLENAIYRDPPKIIVLDGFTEKTYFYQVPELVDMIQSGYDRVLTVEQARKPVTVYRRR